MILSENRIDQLLISVLAKYILESMIWLMRVVLCYTPNYIIFLPSRSVYDYCRGSNLALDYMSN